MASRPAVMRPRPRVLLVAASWLAAVALAAVSLVLLALGSSGFPPDPPPAWLAAAMYLFYLPLPTVGALLTVRRPENPIGPMLLVAGLSAFLWFGSAAYAVFAVERPDLPGRVIAGWIATWVFEPYFLALLVFVPLLFPDGRFLSRRWRAIGWLAAVVGACQLAAQAFVRPVLMTNDPNPLAVAELAPIYSLLIGILGAPLALAFLAISCAAVVIRFRRSRGIERQQVKWFLYAVSVALLTILIVFALLAMGALPDNIAAPATYLAFALPPLAVGIAVLRYRLYDIDLVINRTVVYGISSATIAVAFFAGIVVLQAILRPLTSGSEVAVAVSTLVSFALFQPLRARVQAGVDRRFYRSRYDAARTLEDFSVHLRDEVDLDSVRADLLDAVQRTVQPAHASVWLRR
jgi:hypothetical protein